MPESPSQADHLWARLGHGYGRRWGIGLSLLGIAGLAIFAQGNLPAVSTRVTAEATETDGPVTVPTKLDIEDPARTRAVEFFARWLATLAEPWQALPQTLNGSPFGTRVRQNDVPQNPYAWEFDQRFASEAFRFVRVKFNSSRNWGPYGKWYTDFPDCDWNFSLRLHQLTTINVNPEPEYLELTDPRIFDYPFLYMIEPGYLVLSDAEARAMRDYLDRGGFIMVDDFWGEREWYNFITEMKKVFPDRTYRDLDLDHPIFNIVYDLPAKPQIPSIYNWMRYGVTYERQDAQEVHYRAFVDDQERVQMIICHNTDLGDGWEREGESREYFEMFSEKSAYPLGINIVVYAMTH